MTSTDICKTNWWKTRSAATLSKAVAAFAMLRYAAQGRGKSGGARVIYYWVKDNHQIYMLVVYPKSKKDDLTDKETAILRDLVKEP